MEEAASLLVCENVATRKECKIFHVFASEHGDRGGAVVKVLCYKSEGRWFDPGWCHWNF